MGILHTHGVLHEPFINGFGGVGHIDGCVEGGLGQDVGEGGCVVHVEAIQTLHVSDLEWDSERPCATLVILD